MTFCRDIESPHVLASLPQPIDAVDGRIRAAAVYSLSGPRKRKRAEVVVGVDGEAVNIYNIQPPRLITSFAIPPQTYLTCPPCSVHFKKSKALPARRITYYCSSRSSGGHKPQISCFAEEQSRDSLGDVNVKSRELARPGGKVVCIEPLPNTRIDHPNEPHDLIIVRENGRVECIKGDLSASRWDGDIAELIDTDATRRLKFVAVQISILTTLAVAKNGLLREREDLVAASIDQPEKDSESPGATPLLCVVFHAESAYDDKVREYLSIFSLPHQSHVANLQQNFPIRHLDTWLLPLGPHNAKQGSGPTSYNMHVSSGVLYALERGSIKTLDLTGTLPRLSRSLTVAENEFDSFLCVAPSQIFAAGRAYSGLYNTKFNSIHGILRHKNAVSIPESERNPIVLCDYFTSVGLIVGIEDQTLVGIQLDARKTFSKTARTAKSSDGLLIDSIGKGFKADIQHESQLKKFISRLNDFAASRDIKKFEECVAQELQSTGNVRRKSKSSSHLTSQSDLNSVTVNGVKALDLPNGHVVEPAEGRHLSRKEGGLAHPEFPTEFTDQDRSLWLPRITYALSRMIRWAEEEKLGSGQVRVVFLPPNLFQWIVANGHFTLDLVESALRLNTSSANSARSLQEGDLVSAIVQYDPDMVLLGDILHQSCYLPASELVQAIKLLIQSLDTTLPSEAPDHPLTNGWKEDHITDNQIQDAVDDASKAIEHAMSILEHGLPVRSQTLHAALSKLHSFPTEVIIRTLRQQLSRHELVFLIHLLRIELREGGWVSRYTATPNASSAFTSAQGEPANHAIVIIANLLNCALSSVGIGGWLSSASSGSADATDELLQGLHQEVSAAIEGIHEITYLKRLIAEFLRFGQRQQEIKASNSAPLATTTMTASRKRRWSADKAPSAAQLPIQLAQPDPEATENRILPLGLRPEAARRAVDRTRVDLGGDVLKRSKRDIGNEISKRVPKYSVERIRI